MNRPLKVALIIFIAIFSISVLSASIAYSQTKITGAAIDINNLVGYWKFDETSGQYTYDSSGNGHTGTVIGPPKWETGKCSKALNFNGNYYVDLGLPSALGLTGSSMTIEAWVKSKEGGTIISSYDSDNTQGFLLVMQSDGKIRFQVYGGFYTDSIITSQSFDNNMFHHIIAIFSSGGRVLLYIDGQPAQNPTQGGSAIDKITLPNLPVEIGRAEGSDYGYFNGVIDEVIIWKTALTTSDINTRYSDASNCIPLLNPPPSKVAEYKFDDITNPGKDSADANPVAIFGGTDQTANDRCGGDALSFDGSTGYAKSQNSLTISRVNGFSFSAWVFARSWESSVGLVEVSDGNYVRVGLESQGVPNTLSMWYQTSADKYISWKTTRPPFNEWVYVVGTINGTASGNGAIYYNGVSQPVIFSTAGTSATSTTKPLYIGAIDAVPEYTFNGIIDDVIIWSGALTEAQIQEEYAACIAPAGPTKVAEYTFDDGTAIDSSSYENDGTIVGATTTTGVCSNALSFNVNNWVEFPNDASLNFGTGDFTIEMWIKPHDLGSYPVYTPVIEKRENYAYGYLFGLYYISQYDGTDAYFHITDQAGNVAEILKGAVAVDNWNYLVAERRGNQIRLYRNGVLQGTADASAVGNIDPSASLIIGNNYESSTTLKPYDIDEMLIWKRALEDDDILDRYNSPCATLLPPPTKVAEYTFDDGAATATDYSGTHTGTISGAGSEADGACNSAYSMDFDGIDDYISFASAADLKFGTGDLTLEAWVKTSKTTDIQRVVGEIDATPNYAAYQLSVYQSKAWAAATDCSGGSNCDTWMVSRHPVQSTTTVADGNWHYLVFTRKGNVETIYVDGEPDGTITEGPWNTDAGGNLMIGSAGTGYYFSGLIDEVKVWNGALNATTIANRYDACTAAPAPACTDEDGDDYSIEGGACGPVDCDDTSSAINPDAGEICADLGIDYDCDGDIGCDDSDCFSKCETTVFCGNGIIEGTEKCDGTNFSGETCETKRGANYAGTLVCTTDCQTIDASLCTYSPAAGCGDGTCDPEETCGTCEADCGDCLGNCSDTDKYEEVSSNQPWNKGVCTDAAGNNYTDVCTDNILAEYSCANGTCIKENYDCYLEFREVCQDGVCTLPNCGNGTCDPDESCHTCVDDCGICPVPDCGNGICENTMLMIMTSKENNTNCPEDCTGNPCQGPINLTTKIIGNDINGWLKVGLIPTGLSGCQNHIILVNDEWIMCAVGSDGTGCDGEVVEVWPDVPSAEFCAAVDLNVDGDMTDAGERDCEEVTITPLEEVPLPTVVTEFTIAKANDFEAGIMENISITDNTIKLAIDSATGMHYAHGIWESAEQTMPSRYKLSKLVINYHDASADAYIDEIKVNVAGETKARYSISIVSGSSIELKNNNLTLGTFDDVAANFTVAIDFVGGSTPVIDSISGYFTTIPPVEQSVFQNIISGSRGGSGGRVLSYLMGEPKASCGDGNCSVTESAETCCYDCGCPSGQSCRWDWCWPPQVGEVCGNSKVEGKEECDKTDDSNCRGLCRSDCTCAYKTGDGICQTANGETAENSPNDCYVVPQKKANNLYFGLMLFTLLVGVGGGGYWWFVQRPKEDLGGLAEEHDIHVGATITQAKEFISKCKERGYSDMQIRILLLRYGWTEEDIFKAFG